MSSLKRCFCLFLNDVQGPFNACLWCQSSEEEQEMRGKYHQPRVFSQPRKTATSQEYATLYQCYAYSTPTNARDWRAAIV